MRRTPMKRTGFARKTEGPRHIRDVLQDAIRGMVDTLEVGNPGQIPPRPFFRVPAPSAPIFNPQPKHEYVRDDGYRRFVASLPCFVCGIAGRSQAAHSNAPEHGKGGAIKASDDALFPLCADAPGEIGCHTRHDQAKDGLTREERRAREVDFIARMAAIPRP